MMKITIAKEELTMFDYGSIFESFPFSSGGRSLIMDRAVPDAETNAEQNKKYQKQRKALVGFQLCLRLRFSVRLFSR